MLVTSLMNTQKTVHRRRARRFGNSSEVWRRNTKRGGAQGKQTERMCSSERENACENINQCNKYGGIIYNDNDNNNDIVLYKLADGEGQEGKATCIQH